MSNPIADHLRFFRDLGIEDVYLPPEVRRGLLHPTPTDAGAAVPAASASGPKQPRRAAAPAPPPPMPPPPAPTEELFSSAAPADPLPVLQEIEAELVGCTRCGLHEGRTKIVFGSGNPQAKLVFVGEGPGADEDAQGLPFVGRAGQLLTQMINNTAQREGIPISRDDVYICNVVKCRPPGNRNPEPVEMKTCGAFLERQLEAIRPKAICLLGGTAAKFVLKTTTGITKLRGEWQQWRGIPVMPTYHPSFLLRPYAQDRKREAWLDLRAVLHYVFD